MVKKRWARKRRNQNEQKQIMNRGLFAFLRDIPLQSKPEPSHDEPDSQALPPPSPEPNPSLSTNLPEEARGYDESIDLDPTVKDIGGFPVMIKSSNPEKDFMESAETMIRANKIRRMEELENLLEVYLLANNEKHAEVIVRAFQKVWFSISFERFDCDFDMI